MEAIIIISSNENIEKKKEKIEKIPYILCGHSDFNDETISKKINEIIDYINNNWLKQSQPKED